MSTERNGGEKKRSSALDDRMPECHALFMANEHDVRRLEAGRNDRLTASERAACACEHPEDAGTHGADMCELDEDDDDSFCIFCRCFGRGCNCP